MNSLEMLLAQGAEEGSEFAQACVKILRFGPDSTFQGESNLMQLRKEFIDVLGVASLLQDEGLLPRMNDPEVAFGVQAKREKVKRYMDVSEQLGTLQR
jgi:hypothetical protein